VRLLLDSNAYSGFMAGANLVSRDRHFEHVDGIAWIQLPSP
jgi:hypothetical protein